MSGAPQKLRILLVDDSEDDTLMAQAVFKRLGLPHALKTMNDPRQALDYLRCEGKYDGRKPELPDLLLLDINMPMMDGFTLLAAMKSDPKLKKIPVIMLTTSASPADIRRSFDGGAASYLTKPSSFDGYLALMTDFGKYWGSVSALPQ